MRSHWDRRRFARIEVDLPLTEGDVLAPNQARTLDVSVWGLRYVTTAQAVRGRSREVRLAFSLPMHPQTIHAIGLVTKVDQDALFCTTSVRFTHINPQDHERLRSFVRQRRAA
ncbi:MAG: PilZ domain-containing protein [Pseudomonadota bacterium]